MKLKSTIPKGIKSYEDFWPYYLLEHTHPKNQACHFLSTSLVLLIIIYAVYVEQVRWLLLAPVVGYLFSWGGHFFIQKNQPTASSYLLWSLVGDLHMYFKMWSGKMDEEIKKAEATIKANS